MKKRLQTFIVCLLIILIVAGVTQVPNKAYAQDDLNVQANAAILVDADSGKILYEKNADKALGIASMSKMLTEYILLKAIKEHKVSWDQKVTVDNYVYKVSQRRDLSNVPLRKGAQYTIKELYQAMAIYSANAATIAIAETLAGSETNYLKMMNKQAKELGLTDYKFVNATGLNNRDLDGMQPKGTSPTAENEMSARSVAKLAYHLVTDFPDSLKTTSIPKLKFRAGTDDEIDMQNWNWMLPSLVYGEKGVDGLKTGTTDFAGYCFTGTAKRNGMRIITVVMNAKGSDGDGYKARFTETKKMMDYAFNNYSLKTIYAKNSAVKNHKTIPVENGKDKTANIVTNSPLKLPVKNGEENMYKPVFTLDKTKLNKDGKLVAPAKKGTAVGTLSVQYKNGTDYGYLYGKKSSGVKLVTKDEVEKANWFVRMMRGIGGLFSNMWNSTVGSWF
ncbi:D-alanyl-D-alanine carboxypeptidase family protein [Heyndrickxia ginsengihumi]|uniref:D-alanyl-D-alanine carboxypeptidase family protein n=1 Tax=Heyndrickxia ginsengihumi TaxID=363870 RepID=UPI003D1A941C